MEKAVESCKLFTKTINCDLNTTAQECEDTKASFTKYCSNKECQGDYVMTPGMMTCIYFYKANIIPFPSFPDSGLRVSQ